MRRLLIVAFAFVLCSCQHATPSDSQISIEQLYNSLKCSVTRIQIYNEDSKTWQPDGSGFIYNRTTVLTAKHCVDFKGTFRVLIDGQPFTIKKTWFSPEDDQDIAVLTLEKPTDEPCVPVAKNLPTIGSHVYSIGYPLDYGLVLSDGYVNQYPQPVLGIKDIFGFSAPIAPGNSGGPLFNVKGEIVGMVFAVDYRGTNLYFASTCKSIARGVEESQKLPSGQVPETPDK